MQNHIEEMTKHFQKQQTKARSNGERIRKCSMSSVLFQQYFENNQ